MIIHIVGEPEELADVVAIMVGTGDPASIAIALQIRRQVREHLEREPWDR